MKPTSEILERIEKCSSEHKDGVFTRLYRYLLREDIYYAAYQKLYANKGATTQGIDDDTADGFSDFYVKELIQSLKDGTYKANPVRREYIPKKNGKLRPLGIPSFRDKLLQEVVRMILEAIYEPVFDSHSHGFRPGKSCHTALHQISSDFTGVVWFIEGDIQGCFDNINHEKLIEILSRKIKDSRFLNIIRQFLKAGYIENWKYNATYSGSPQGGICSPILANIYLNELDKKFREIAERFDKPRSAYQTTEYHAANKELKRLSYWIDHTADEAARQELIDQHTRIIPMWASLAAGTQTENCSSFTAPAAITMWSSPAKRALPLSDDLIIMYSGSDWNEYVVLCLIVNALEKTTRFAYNT